MIKEKSIWHSDNGLWKVYGIVRVSGAIHTVEVRIMKLENNRYEFYYGKQVPKYVLKARDSIYEELK